MAPHGITRIDARSEGSTFSFLISTGQYIVGSGPDCSLLLQEPGVAARHLRIEVGDGGIRLFDLGSAGGTFLGDRRIEEAEAKPGDTVRIGRVELTFDLLAPDDSKLAISIPPRAGGKAAGAPTAAGGAGEASGRRLSIEELGFVDRLADFVGSRAPESLGGALAGLCRELGVSRACIMSARGNSSPLACANWGPVPSEELVTDLMRELELRLESSPDRTLLTIPTIEGTQVSVVRLPLDAVEESLLLVERATALDPVEGLVGRLLLRLFGFIQSQEKRWSGAWQRSPTGTPLVFPDACVRGRSIAWRKLEQQMEIALRGRLAVLIQGETGAGKEVVARTLHASSGVGEGPFVAVNCAAIPGELLEAEMFGVEKGTATGVEAKRGWLESASGGSLFLDEIGELPRGMQAKLLRALQEKQIFRLGGRRPVPVDFQLLSATNSDLRECVAEGRFRSDFFYRVAEFVLEVPALRERREDIPELVQHFLFDAVRGLELDVRGLTAAALHALCLYDWPGNIRELRYEMRRLVASRREDGVIDSACVARLQSSAGTAKAEGTSAAPSLKSRVSSMEREAIVRALAETGGNRSKAARLLGLSRNGLLKKMQRLSLVDTSP